MNVEIVQPVAPEIWLPPERRVEPALAMGGLPHRKRVAEKRKRIVRSGGFEPTSISEVTAWRRLTGDGETGGAYEEMADLLGGPSLLQSSAGFRPAANTANGHRIATYDGTDDYMEMAVASASNNNSPGWGWMRWVRPHNTGVQGMLYSAAQTSGASANRVSIFQFGTSLLVDFFWNNTAARRATTTSVFAANVWVCLGVFFDGTASGDAAYTSYSGVTAHSPAFSNNGSPPLSEMPSTLVQPTGVHAIGIQTPDPTNLRPFDGDMATNCIDFDGPIAAEALANLVAFEDPS